MSTANLFSLYLYKVLKRFAVFFYLSLAVCQLKLHAQIKNGYALFENLSTMQGLSSNSINCIFQDSQGFIWIGTDNGLNRFDGVQILHWQAQPGNQNSLPGSFICNITEDSSHRLWIGTNEGVSCYDPVRNQFRNYLSSPQETENLKSTRFYVTITRSQEIWVGSNQHLTLLDPAIAGIRHFPMEQLSIPHTGVFRAYTPLEDRQNRLWIPSSHGVKRFDRKTRKFKSFHLPDIGVYRPENEVTKIFESPSGKIIAGTWGGGLLVFEEGSQQFEIMKLGPSAPAVFEEGYRNMIHDIGFHQGNCYLATSYGMLVFPQENILPGSLLAFTQFLPVKNAPGSMSAKELMALLVDRRGTIWLGGRSVDKLDPSKQLFQNHFLPETDNKKISIGSIVNDGNRFLIAGGQAYWWNNEAFRSLTLPIGYNDPADPFFIWEAAKGKSHYWLGTTRGLWQVSSEGKLLKKYEYQKGLPNKIAGRKIWRVYEDSRGMVWMNLIWRGISRLDPATGIIRNYFHEKDQPNSLFNNLSSAFFEDRKGNIWFTGLGNKIYCYRPGPDSFSVYTLQLRNEKMIRERNITFADDAGNGVLVATELGLLRFNEKDSFCTRLANHPDLQYVNSALIDSVGYYWFLCNNSLLQYDPATKIFKRYTAIDGIPSTEDANAITADRQGLVLAGEGFITRFNYQRSQTVTRNFPVLITKALANGKDRLFPDQHHRLSYLSGIEFHFTALQYTNASENQFQYRLLGAQSEWSNPSKERSVSFARLSPGEYVFEVRAADAESNWSDQVARFRFKIARPYYKSVWFFAILILLGIMGVYAFSRYRLRKSLELEKLRTRIATDLHDDIGATLSSISMYSESLKGQVKDTHPHLETILEKMGTNSREMVAGMSDIVWAINPLNDTAEKLLQRMESYAFDICASREIRLDFQYDDPLQQIQLPLEIRKNIYLIFKEAVNNAVKYSEASLLQINVRWKEKQIHMDIHDNGKGFDPIQPRQGNGLTNMRFRAEEIGGQLQVISNYESGTRVILSVTVE